MKVDRRGFLAAGLGIAGTAATAKVQGPPVVETTGGRLAGIRTNGVSAFRNIPYAAPPVGPLRFRPPIAPAPWTGVRDAAAFGPRCPQIPRAGPPIFAPFDMDTGESEDCLSLNVWTRGQSGRRR